MHINIRWNLRFFHMVYTRQARAIAKRLVEAVQSVRGATRHDFHDAVGEVTDPPGKAELPSLTHCEPTEPNALNPAPQVPARSARLLSRQFPRCSATWTASRRFADRRRAR